ncbi:efflux transporter outer membrane subunit [Janthinobacterium fluminis]|uniref:Efflux transporter outer membrane subunit n=1 Tax=Janthinobacterium fluminis TaxID=2987524 RepID=A0ABT5JZA3_9BURK|nr:efflux transporter outer membrane subunit [Janthinobacterium fluminis]MDC8758062.1 efflux transporter outer membrane subunit [Janthinobacterium fluminis]
MKRPLAILICAALGACAHDTAPPRAAPAVPAHFSSAVGGAAPGADAWAALGDAGLTAWIERVWAGNTDIAAGLARLDAAAADLRAATAEQSPRVALETSVERRKLSKFDQGESDADTRNPATRYAGQLTLGYELDLRGRVRAAVRAGQAERAASGHDLTALRLSLARQTAELWLARAELHAAAGLAEDSARLRRQWRQGEQARLGAGLSNANPLRQQDSESVGADLLVQRQRDAAQRIERGLCLLAASMPADCALPPAQPLRQLRLPAVGNAVPAQLLQRRPDLAAAQARYDAARARIDEADAARWPALTLGGAVGINAGGLGALRKSGASSWSLMPQLELPLFDGGRRQADLARAKSAAAEQYAQWHGSIARAVHEVEDSSAAVLHSQVNYAARQRQHAIAEAQLDSVRRARRAGMVHGSAEWSAHLAQLQAEQDSVAARHEQLLAAVNLIAALGGGWDGAAEAAPRRP